MCGKDIKGIRDMCTVSTKSKSDATYGRASKLQGAYILANITNENNDQIYLSVSKYRYHKVCMGGFIKMIGSDIKDTSIFLTDSQRNK